MIWQRLSERESGGSGRNGAWGCGRQPAKPSEDTLRKIADVFGDDFDELMQLAGRIPIKVKDYMKADPGMPEFMCRAQESNISSEKLHAYTMPHNYPNSRVKDFPTLLAIVQTFKHRATHPVPKSVPAPPKLGRLSMCELQRATGSNGGHLMKSQKAVQTFLNPVLSGTSKRWGTEAGTWSSAQEDES